MRLPQTLRDALVEEGDAFLDAYSSSPDPEAVAEFVVEQFDLFQDERGVDDVLFLLEESGQLEDTFQNSLESEMASNDEFEFTGEEIVSLIEQMCGIEWVDDATFDDELLLGDDEDDEDDEDDDVEDP